MREHGKTLFVFCSVILAIFSSNNLFAQWSAFKKGLQRDIQVAVETDTMLVAHHNAINFSFIVTTKETPSSDIYLENPFVAKKDEPEIWRTTERFWGRLQKKNRGIKTIFTKPFLANLRHPSSNSIPDKPAQLSDTNAGISTPVAPPKSLLERVNEAREKGDLELASLLLVMFQQENNASSDSAKQAAHDELQKKLGQEKALLKKLYDYALAYEQDEDWEMAAAVYENLLALGEFKDARSKFLSVLPRLRKASNNLKLEKKYREGLAALQVQDWLSAMVAFENVIALEPNYRNAKTRLKEVRIALAKDGVFEGNYYSNGHTRPEDEAYSLNANLQDNFFSNRQNNSRRDIEIFYNEALSYIGQQDWRRAHHVLKILETRTPLYKNTHQLMLLVEKNLASRSNKIFHLWMIGLGSLFISFVGFSAYSPMFRAGFFALTGQYQHAAQIYEKLLLKNPGKLKVYNKLGIIYLKTGLGDENAIRIFSMIKKLDLRSGYREEMDNRLQMLRSTHERP